MGVDVDEVEVGIDPKDRFDYRKGDEMIPSEKDWKFLGGQDLLEGLPNPAKGLLLIPER